jgi:hypothetical protein
MPPSGVKVDFSASGPEATDCALAALSVFTDAATAADDINTARRVIFFMVLSSS